MQFVLALTIVPVCASLPDLPTIDEIRASALSRLAAIGGFHAAIVQTHTPAGTDSPQTQRADLRWSPSGFWSAEYAGSSDPMSFVSWDNDIPEARIYDATMKRGLVQSLDAPSRHYVGTGYDFLYQTLQACDRSQFNWGEIIQHETAQVIGSDFVSGIDVIVIQAIIASWDIRLCVDPDRDSIPLSAEYTMSDPGGNAVHGVRFDIEYALIGGESWLATRVSQVFTAGPSAGVSSIISVIEEDGIKQIEPVDAWQNADISVQFPPGTVVSVEGQDEPLYASATGELQPYAVALTERAAERGITLPAEPQSNYARAAMAASIAGADLRRSLENRNPPGPSATWLFVAGGAAGAAVGFVALRMR